MKTGTLLLIAGGGYLAYRLFQKASAATSLYYSVKKIRYIGSDLGKTELELTLSVINPSNESLSFQKFFGQLRFKGNPLVNVIKDGAGAGITIQPAAETIITIPVYIQHLSAALAIKDIIEKLINKQNVEGLVLTGTLYAGGGLAVPLTQTLNFTFSNNQQQPITGITDCFRCETVMGVLN